MDRYAESWEQSVFSQSSDGLVTCRTMHVGHVVSERSLALKGRLFDCIPLIFEKL